MHRLRAVIAPILNKIAMLFVGLGFTPNGLTFVGLLITGVSAGLVAIGQLAAGGAVLLFAGAFDMFDGAVARLTGKESNFGALLDSVIDRVSEAVVLLGLLVYVLDKESSVGAILVYLSLAGSIIVSYVRARAEGLGIECKVGLLQRPERVVMLGVGLIAAQWWEPAILAVLSVIAALSIFTTVQRMMAVGQSEARKQRG